MQVLTELHSLQLGGRIHSLPFPASGGCWHSLACGCTSLGSTFTWSAPLCVPSSHLSASNLSLPLFIRTLAIGFWVHWDNSRLPLLRSIIESHLQRPYFQIRSHSQAHSGYLGSHFWVYPMCVLIPHQDKE